MTLPNHQHAIIDLAKLRDYVLNPENPRGKHKARVFLRTLGFDWRDAETLARQISHGLASEGCEDRCSGRVRTTLSSDRLCKREGRFGPRPHRLDSSRWGEVSPIDDLLHQGLN